MPSFFAALDTRTGPQMYIYRGSSAVTSGSTFSTVETTNLSTFNQTPRIAQFGPQKQLFAFVGDGVYRTQDGGNIWTQVYSPSTLTASSARRFGPIVLYIDNEPYLCIGWRGTADRIARSKDGITWEESQNLTFNRNGGFSNLAVQGNIVWSCPDIADSQTSLRWFDFSTLTGGQTVNIFFSGPEAGGFVIIGDRIFWAMYQDGTSPDRVQILELLGGNTPIRLATFDVTLDGSAGATAWASNGRIYFILKGSGSTGLRLFRSNTAIDTIEEITSSAVPTALQNDNEATLTETMVDPSNLSGEVLIYVRAAGDVWDIYQWNATTEILEEFSSNIGSTLHTLPFMYSVTGTQFYNPSNARVDILNTETVIDGVKIYFKLYGENGAAQSANVAFTYASNPQDIAITSPATLVNASAGTISGNQVTGLSANNGATLYTVVWNVGADGFDPNTRFKLIGTMSINRPVRRRRKRKRWYKF